MNIPRNRIGAAWGYGVGLLGLLITVAIGIYIYGQLAEQDVRAYNKTQDQIEDIQKTLNERNANLSRQYGLEPPGPKKNRFAVVLLDPGDREDKVVEAIRTITKLTAEQARDLVRSAPMEVKNHMSSSEAEAARRIFEDIGAMVDVRDEEQEE